jgi:hypothetical protein
MQTKKHMASKAITDMMLKKEKHMWELKSGCLYCRRACSQLSYYGWHDGMCFNVAYKLMVKKF